MNRGKYWNIKQNEKNATIEDTHQYHNIEETNHQNESQNNQA